MPTEDKAFAVVANFSAAAMDLIALFEAAKSRDEEQAKEVETLQKQLAEMQSKAARYKVERNTLRTTIADIEGVIFGE